MSNKPKTLEEAVNQLFKEWSTNAESDALKIIRNNSVEELIARAHHTAGRAIRNDWHLWHVGEDIVKDIRGRFGVNAGDDVSSLILHGLFSKLKGFEPEYEKLAAEFREYNTQVLIDALTPPKKNWFDRLIDRILYRLTGVFWWIGHPHDPDR